LDAVARAPKLTEDGTHDRSRGLIGISSPAKNGAFIGSYSEIFMHMQVRPAYEPVMSVFVPLPRELD
jgi:hypothetical protein